MPRSPAANVREVMAAIDRAWHEGRSAEMYPYLHPDVIMVLPDFSGRLEGRDALLLSFKDVCTHARVLEYARRDEQIAVVGNVAFLHYSFDLLLERASSRTRATGREIWAFERVGGMWFAIWRTMVDVRKDGISAS